MDYRCQGVFFRIHKTYSELQIPKVGALTEAILVVIERWRSRPLPIAPSCPKLNVKGVTTHHLRPHHLQALHCHDINTHARMQCLPLSIRCLTNLS